MLRHSPALHQAPCQPSWRGVSAWNAGSGWDVGSLSDTWSTYQNREVHHESNPSQHHPSSKRSGSVSALQWTDLLHLIRGGSIRAKELPRVFWDRVPESRNHDHPLEQGVGNSYGHFTGTVLQASPGEGGGRGTEDPAGAGLALDRTLSVPASGKADGSDALSAGTDPSNCSQVDGTPLSTIQGRGVFVVVENAISRHAETHRIPSFTPSHVSTLYVRGVRIVFPGIPHIRNRSVSVQSILDRYLGDSGWLQFFSVVVLAKPTGFHSVLVEGGIVSHFGNSSRVWASKYGLAIAVGDSFGYCVDSMGFLCRAWVWTRGMALAVMALDGHQMSSLK